MFTARPDADLHIFYEGDGGGGGGDEVGGGRVKGAVFFYGQCHFLEDMYQVCPASMKHIDSRENA